MFADKKTEYLPRVFVLILGLLCSGVACVAQDTQTTSTRQSGQQSVKTEVRSGEIVYVSGNDVVLKMDTGEVKHFNIPNDFHFNIDGQDMTVHDLKPGMHVSRTITTTTTPKTVETVRTVNGTVWYVNPPSTVILTLPDGTNKQYKVPEGQKFLIDGKEQSVFHLRKGMKVSGTAITDRPETVVNISRSGVSGTAPPPPTPSPAPETPAMTGVLLIEQPPAAQTAPAETPATLPKTATNMPLIGLAGLIALALFAALRVFRKSSFSH
jgi:LPXTG-motif cell wall-anchored protein